MPETKLNIYQKVSAITEAIGLIGKDANAPAAMGGYAFTSHGALLGHIRHELTSRSVVIRPSGEEIIRADNFETTSYDQKGNLKAKLNYRTIVKFKFTVVNGDDPTDFFVDSWIGEGIDTSDKGIQKAGTSAEKYYLMKLFKVGDKDDPDGLDADNNGRVASESATINPKQEANPVATPQQARADGSPGAFSHRATDNIYQKTQLEVKVEEAGLAKPVDAPDSTNVSDISPEETKNQLENLVWLGEQLPPAAGWFRGKVVALVSLWEVKQKNGTNSPEEAQAGSGINHIFNQLAMAHTINCKPKDGELCDHINAAKIALTTGGRIVDPATK